MAYEYGAQLLTDTIGGDPTAFGALALQDHHTLQQYAAQLKPEDLVLRRKAVRNVLVALERDQVSFHLVQEWASFVRRGYIRNQHLLSSGSLPPQQAIRPIPISYDALAEEQITEIISRLDEIGDLIDGEITRCEIEAILTELS